MRRPLKCVIVDDDKDFFPLFSFAISRLSSELEVTEFTESVQALEFIVRTDVDLIVTDVNMPLFNGLLLTAAVRSFDKEVPIVVMSSEDLEEESLVSGANAFVSKQNLIRQLPATVRQLLGQPSTVESHFGENQDRAFVDIGAETP